MQNDKLNLIKAEKDLNNFILRTPSLSKFHYYENTLFSEFNGDRFTINWSSSKQVIEVAKILGFNTKVQDKKTGADKDSVLENHLKTQKGINDEFLSLYFNYNKNQARIKLSQSTLLFLQYFNPNFLIISWITKFPY